MQRQIYVPYLIHTYLTTCSPGCYHVTGQTSGQWGTRLSAGRVTFVTNQIVIRNAAKLEPVTRVQNHVMDN